MSVTPYAADNWVGILSSTIQEYVRGATDNITRRRRILNMLRKNNRITYNHTGTFMQWAVEYKRQKLEGFGDGNSVVFSQHDRYKTATLGWRGYAMAEGISEQTMLKNKGEAAIVNLFENVAKNLMRDGEQDLGTQFYIDGNLAANRLRFCGIETFANPGSGAASLAAPVVRPAGVIYGGLDTALQASGGSWAQNGGGNDIWPEGEGDVEYDYFTPLIVDYTSAVATSTSAQTVGFQGTADWKTRCVEAMRYGIIHSRVGDGAEDMLTMGMLSTELFRQFLNNQDAKERYHVLKSDGPSGLYGSGFEGDAFNFDGVDFTYESAVPTNVGYGFNANQMELCSMYGGLMESFGPVQQISSLMYQFLIALFGNVKYNPRRFVKWMAFS